MIRIGFCLTVCAVAVIAMLVILQDAAQAGVRPCREGDRIVRCVWDARHMGNGNGRSYLITHQGELVFITHARAHRMLR